MAIRFLDNNYYKSPFVRGLKGALKSLYSFIICDCTPSGIWAMDMEAASMYIGFEVNGSDFDKSFVVVGKAIGVGSGRYFFPDFIEHQYPGGLQDDNKAHKNIILELKKIDFLKEEIVSKIIKNEQKKVSVFFLKNKGALKGLPSPPSHSHSQGQGNSHGYSQGNTEEICEKKWNTKPGATEMVLELDPVKGGAVVELFSISKKHDLTTVELNGLWEVFKKQNFTEKKYYQTKNDVYSHFINWSKTQNINGSTTHQRPTKTSGKGISDKRTDAARNW